MTSDPTPEEWAEEVAEGYRVRFVWRAGILERVENEEVEEEAA